MLINKPRNCHTALVIAQFKVLPHLYFVFPLMWTVLSLLCEEVSQAEKNPQYSNPNNQNQMHTQRIFEYLNIQVFRFEKLSLLNNSDGYRDFYWSLYDSVVTWYTRGSFYELLTCSFHVLEELKLCLTSRQPVLRKVKWITYWCNITVIIWVKKHTPCCCNMLLIKKLGEALFLILLNSLYCTASSGLRGCSVFSLAGC